MNSAEFNKSMEIIVEALKERGYDPYDQICGYLKENNPMYITQHRNARGLIKQLDVKEIQRFISRL